MNAGDLFKFRNIADIHAWTIISDPSVDGQTVLIVNLTSWDRLEDQACVFKAGEHPFIVNRTCIAYARSRVTSDAALEKLRAAGRLEILQSFSIQHIRKIRDGAMLSARMKLDHAQILIDQNLVED
jgi:hypothetical protein